MPLSALFRCPHHTETNYGRDHKPRNFAIWMAGGGIKGGLSIGETDDSSYNITADPVHVHDLQPPSSIALARPHAPQFQDRNFRLTDVHRECVQEESGQKYCMQIAFCMLL